MRETYCSRCGPPRQRCPVARSARTNRSYVVAHLAPRSPRVWAGRTSLRRRAARPVHAAAGSATLMLSHHPSKDEAVSTQHHLITVVPAAVPDAALEDAGSPAP